MTTPKTTNTPSPRFILAMAAVFALVSIYPFFVAWQAHRISGASEPSTCEVLAKRVEAYEDSDGSTNGYYPYLEISHSVDGQRYEREDSGRRFISESDARAAITEFVVGAQIECRYVTGSPAEVIALEQDDGQVRGMLIFGVLLWVIPLGMFLWARTRPDWRP